MHLSYTGIVSRKNQQDEGVGYVLNQWDFKVISSYPDQTDDALTLSNAQCSVYVDTSSPLARLKMRRGYQEILDVFPNIDETGGYVISSSNAFLTSVFVTILVGSDDRGIEYLEKSLWCEHLAVEFSLDFGLSLVENNSLIKRPVTFAEFRSGKSFVGDAVPKFSLVRRHIP